MTLTPAAPLPQAPQEKPPVDPTLLEVDAGIMISGPYEWREHCNACGLLTLTKDPRPHRAISLYEVLTSWRSYRCNMCRQPLWAPKNGANQ
jgi:hypothetical protein